MHGRRHIVLCLNRKAIYRTARSNINLTSSAIYAKRLAQFRVIHASRSLFDRCCLASVVQTKNGVCTCSQRWPLAGKLSAQQQDPPCPEGQGESLRRWYRSSICRRGESDYESGIRCSRRKPTMQLPLPHPLLDRCQSYILLAPVACVG